MDSVMVIYDYWDELFLWHIEAIIADEWEEMDEQVIRIARRYIQPQDIPISDTMDWLKDGVLFANTKET